MEVMRSSQLWQSGIALVLASLATLAFYRLYLHPLAKFPGPKLAGITRYYEGYYDVVKNGQYTFKIKEMHERYGPIARISPHELHINDPAFFEKLYRHDGRWNKYAWMMDAHNVPDAIFTTADYDKHKARRQPLNAYFSKAKVAARKDLITTKLVKLLGRISEFAKEGKGVDVGAATSAFQRDVSIEFVLGKDYNNLDLEDFGIGMTVVAHSSGRIWRYTKHMRWYGPLLLSIPMDFLIKNADENTANFLRYVESSEEETRRLLKAAASGGLDDESPPSIVAEILKSSLPQKDKTPQRVFADVATVTGAGFETTASVLRLVLCHVFNNPDIIGRLRAELDNAAAQASVPKDRMTELRTLEQLPYLTAILMEGMRMSPALGTRSQRIAPDRDLIYDEWRIPAGTPVGMTALLMHMDEKLYPDPERFDPERWVNPEARKKAEKTYAPFSRG